MSKWILALSLVCVGLFRGIAKGDPAGVEATASSINVHGQILERLKNARSTYETKLKQQDTMIAKRILAKSAPSRQSGRSLASIPQTSLDRDIQRGDLELTDLSHRTQILSEWIRNKVDSREHLKRRLTTLDREIRARSSGQTIEEEIESDRPLQRLKVEAQLILELEAEFNKVQTP